MHAKKPVFIKSLLGLLIAASLAFTVYQRSGKSRSEFQSVSGMAACYSAARKRQVAWILPVFRILAISSGLAAALK